MLTADLFLRENTVFRRTARCTLSCLLYECLCSLYDGTAYWYQCLMCAFVGVDSQTPGGAHLGEGGDCPIGHYCPIGTTEPLPCHPGTYSDNTRQAVCDECPAGYYCLANSTTYTTQVCPAGYYCTNGTRHAYEFPCPHGTYSTFTGRTSVDDCQLCPPGQYCESMHHYIIL